MELATIKQLIETQINTSKTIITGDGCSCEATIISDDFAGKVQLARQRLVMATVNDYIKNGELHALALKTYTVAEWEQHS